MADQTLRRLARVGTLGPHGHGSKSGTVGFFFVLHVHVINGCIIQPMAHAERLRV